MRILVLVSAIFLCVATNAAAQNYPPVVCCNSQGGFQSLPAGSTLNTTINGTVIPTTNGDTAVTLAGTQTLTNKSIDASQLTGTIAAGRIGSVTTTGQSSATTLGASDVVLGSQGGAPVKITLAQIDAYVGSTGAPAGGSNTQLQYNNSGALGGITGGTWNGTRLSLPIAQWTACVVGDTLGSVPGTGCVGIGTPAQAGAGLQIALPAINLISPGEQWAIGGIATNNPTSPSGIGGQSNVFGAVFSAVWGGNQNSSAGQTLVEGLQGYAYVRGTASVNGAIGTQSVANILATAGTTVNATGSQNEVGNFSTATVTNAEGGYFGVANSGGGTITNAIGIEIDTINGTNATALNIAPQTGCTAITCFAIQTQAGQVHFGGPLVTDVDTTLHGVTFGQGLTAAVDSTAGGLFALLNNTGMGVTGFGWVAAIDNTSGQYNSYFGTNTGRGISTGSYNTIIGAQVTGLSNPSNNVIIADGAGNIAFRDNATTATITHPVVGGASVAATTFLRPGQTAFAGLSTADPSPQVGDMLNITDASACTINVAVAAGGGTTHSCPTTYNGAGWVALVTH